MRNGGRFALFRWNGFGAEVAVTALLLASVGAYSQEMKLLSAGKGWALINAHLYWTDNDGNNWKDITPLHSGQDAIWNVFFLDESHGWATIASYDGTWQDVRLAIWNGGTWHSIPLDNEGTSLPAVQFANTKHGWLFLWYQHSQGVESPPPSLSVTDDAGATWKKLPTPPAYGSIELLSDKNAVLVDDYNPFTLWLTADGGRKWTKRKLPLPPGVEEPYYAIGHDPGLDFRNRTDGTLVAQLQQEMTLLYSTRNGGRTWQLTTIRPHDDESFPYAACTAGQELVTFERKNVLAYWEILVRRQSGIFSTEIGSSTPYYCEFADRLHGWVLARSNTDLELFSTSDGKHFRRITPASSTGRD